MSDQNKTSAFQRVCAAFPGVVWLRTHDMSRISYINPAVGDVFGITPEDIYAEPGTYIEAIHPDDRSEYRTLLETVRDRASEDDLHQRWEIEYRLCDDRANERILETIFPVEVRDETPLSWAGFTRDIPEQHADRAILELQVDQLELLNQVVRHDIRNEVNLGLDIIRSATRRGEIDEEHFERVQNILHHVSELTKTARDMTDMITTLSDEPDPIGLAPTLKREVATISAVSEETTITIEGEIPDVDVRVNELLSAVFRNLLTNAIQHSDSDDPMVTVSCTTLDGRIAVHIADDGPGIPDDKKELIFESGRTLVGRSGTGFGLPLVETLIAQYGGDIYVSDNEPRGCVFTVLLPLVRAT